MIVFRHSVEGTEGDIALAQSRSVCNSIGARPRCITQEAARKTEQFFDKLDQRNRKDRKERDGEEENHLPAALCPVDQ